MTRMVERLSVSSASSSRKPVKIRWSPEFASRQCGAAMRSCVISARSIGQSLACRASDLVQVLHEWEGSCPHVHRVQHRAQSLAGRCQFVDNSWRHLRVHGAGDQAMGLEAAQPVGERVCADSRQRTLELRESRRHPEELANDEGSPRPVQQCEEPGNTALGPRVFAKKSIFITPISAFDVTDAPCALIET